MEEQTPQTSETAPSASASVVQQTLPAEGGVLKVPMPAKPEINPLKANIMSMANLYTLIFESLVTVDMKGSLQPCLAETWEASEDKKTWTFHLRHGIPWHGNNGEFKAGDVKFTIDALQEIGSSESRFSELNDMIQSCDVVDEYTVKITTDKPRSALVYNMVFPVLPEKYYGDAAGLDTKTPVGTGPYKVDKMSDQGMTLSVNDAWWKKKPYIKTIQAIPIDDNDNQIELAKYQDGTLNFVTTASLTSSKFYEKGKTEVADYMTQYYDCLLPNFSSSMFKDVRIRKALAYGIDKGDIISRALLNHAVATDFPVSPDSELYQGKLKLYEYNTAEAAKLLEEAGWKDLNEDGILEKVENGELKKCSFNLLVLKTPDITYRIDVAKVLAEQLKKLGIEVNIVEKGWDGADAKSNDYKTALENKDFDLALFPYYLARDPDLTALLSSNGAENFSGYASSEMDKILNECASETDENKLITAFGTLEQKFIDDLPQIALYFRTNSLVYSSAVQGVEKVRELNIYNDISKWYMLTKSQD